MPKQIARYSITHGLAGCYIPDGHSGPYILGTRRDLAALIRYELEANDMPARLIREVKLTHLWSRIRQWGSSTAHFSITHKGYEIAFHGLTEAEAEEMDTEA